jgi:hypothetical protein
MTPEATCASEPAESAVSKSKVRETSRDYLLGGYYPLDE